MLSDGLVTPSEFRFEISIRSGNTWRCSSIPQFVRVEIVRAIIEKITALVIPLNEYEESIMRILRLKQVADITGLARSTIYKFIADGLFPKPIPLGDRCVGWLESEVQDWISKKIKERDLQNSLPA